MVPMKNRATRKKKHLSWPSVVMSPLQDIDGNGDLVAPKDIAASGAGANPLNWI